MGGDEQNVTVETAYHADRNVRTLTAKNPTTGDQVTTYGYRAEKLAGPGAGLLPDLAAWATLARALLDHDELIVKD